MNYIVGFPNISCAGIGHQFHIWILGLILSIKVDCKFIHSPFFGKYGNYWEDNLRFGSGFNTLDEIKFDNTIELTSSNSRCLSHTDNTDIKNSERIIDKWISTIKSHDNTLFKLPRAQLVGFLSKEIHFLCRDYLKECYWNNNDAYVWNNDKINISVYIRRGNITSKNNPERWISIEKYKNVMNQLREKYRNCHFHVFSQGDMSQFLPLHNNDVNLYIDNTFTHEGGCLDRSDLLHLKMISSSDVIVCGLGTFCVLACYLSSATVYYFPFLNYTQWENIENFYNIDTLKHG